MLQMPYRELIGTLLWIANGTRPVIAYAVTTLAKYTSNPGEIHWQALLRVLGYLQATLHHCICYTRNEEQENGIAVSGHARGILPTMSDFKCYVDASYAGEMKIHGGALQDTCLRSVVVQSPGRVECKRP